MSRREHFAIGVESAHPREFPGLTLYQGKVAEGQTGYRMIHKDELEPQQLDNVGTASGYRSRGKFLIGPEKHSRGVTMFSASPLTDEEMQRHGATHQVEVDISGLPYRTLKKPTAAGAIPADLGLGLGVVGEMDYSRIKRIKDRAGTDVHDDHGAGTPGEAISNLHFMDTGYRTRGR